LKQYVQRFYDYGVDGNMLLLLDDEDFDNLEVFSGVHRKKITVELERIFPKRLRVNIKSDSHVARRERIRRAKLQDEATVVIQRVYRGYLGRRSIKVMKERERIQSNKRMLDWQVETTAYGWWTDRDIPSKHIQPLTVEDIRTGSSPGPAAGTKNLLLLPSPTSPTKLRTSPQQGNNSTVRSSLPPSPISLGSSSHFRNNQSMMTNSNRNDGASTNKAKLLKGDVALIDPPAVVRTFASMNITLPGESEEAGKRDSSLIEAVLRLPPLKTFGRKADHFGCKGWGRYDSNGQWLPVAQQTTATAIPGSLSSTDNHNNNQQQFLGDANPSKLLTLRLQHNGYDERRDEIFRKSKTVP
jgi:hypothetical protein